MPHLTDPARRGLPGRSPLERGPEGDLVIRPDPKRLPRLGSLAALPFAVVGAIRLLLLGWVGVAILVSAICLSAGLAFLIRRHRAFHSYARLTPATLTVKPWYARPRTIPREAVAQVVLVTVNLGFSEPDQSRMLFLDRGGRCLLALDCLGIPPSDASAFAQALGVQVSTRTGGMSPKQLRKAYPGSISAFYAHQVAWGIGLGLAICVLVVVGVVGWAALTGQLGPPKPVALGVTQAERTQGDQITVTRVDNPARASIPASAGEPGTHFVGVVLRVKNTGSHLIDAPDTALTVRDSNGARYSVDDIDDPAGAKLNADTGVDPGKTGTAYVLIRVPDAYVVTSVEFNSSGNQDDTLTWIVPPQPPPPTPTPAPLGQAFPLGDEQVTVLAVDDPAAGQPSTTSLPAGDHLVGVEVRIAATGSSETDPPYELISVTDSTGNPNDHADISANAGPSENPVKGRQTVTTTVYFDVPAGARVVDVDCQYDPAGLGGGRATVEWAVPPP